MNISATKTACRLLPAVLMLAFPSPPSQAEVINVSPSGFLIKQDITVNLPPDQAYKILVSDIGNWWNSAHTFSGDAKNTSIDARAGGCFCEKLPNGGSVQHLAVVYVVPGKVLRMTGALGPLQSSGLAGSMTWQITALPGATADKPASKMEVSYSVGGYMQGGFDKMAPAVNGMLAEQLGRLMNFANTGKVD